jgi:type IV pilus assembly protein PilC
MMVFCRQLATSHGAGIPILRSLDIIANQTHNWRLRNVVSQMSDSIKGGSTLEQAAREQSRYLPKFFIELVGAGEIGGRLVEIFESLADYYERMSELVRKVIGKLIYPICLLLFLFITICFMGALGKASSEQGLDFNLLMQVFLQNIARLLLFIGVVLLVVIVLARMGLLGWVSGLITTFMWPLAAITRKLAISRFARSLGLLIKSGVPITEAVHKAAATANNPYIERSLLRCIPDIQAGESLSIALSPCRYLSDMAREMIHTGEESGKLDQHLQKVADIHEAEAMQAANNLTVVLYVLAILGVAIRIAFFVIGFWMNYYGKMLDDLGV